MFFNFNYFEMAYKMAFSKIVMGTMNWGMWGENMDTNALVLALNTCLENNITTFDHAAIYGNYTTEKQFGVAFKKSLISREKVQFISKCGIQMICSNTNFKVKHYDYSKKSILQSVENSLQNLQTDYLDLLLLHRPSPLMQADEIAEAIEQLKKDGKILSFGVSNFTTSQTQLVQQKVEIQYNQIQFSITQFQAMLDGSLDYMQRSQIVPMAWNPLGTVFKESNPQNERIHQLLDVLSDKYNAPKHAILLAWIVQHPAGIMPVIGTTNLVRIQQSALALSFILDTEDWFALWTESVGNRVP
jgi:predicted oxidoreductase